jgi:hypothetical protein
MQDAVSVISFDRLLHLYLVANERNSLSLCARGVSTMHMHFRRR